MPAWVLRGAAVRWASFHLASAELCLHGVCELLEQGVQAHRGRKGVQTGPDDKGLNRITGIIAVHLLCVGGELFFRGSNAAASILGADSALERAAEIDRLIPADRYVNGIRQRAVGKGILLAGGHGADESLRKGADGRRRFLGVHMCGQLHGVDGRVAVERGGIEFNCAQMARACVFLRREVVHGGEVIVFGLHSVRRDRVRDLRGGIII